LKWVSVDFKSELIFSVENKLDPELRRILNSLNFEFILGSSIDREILNCVLISSDGLEIGIVKDEVPELLPTYFQKIDQIKKICGDQHKAFFDFILRTVQNSLSSMDAIDKEVLFSKRSEMSLLDKVEDVESFTNPGLTSPFNENFYHPTHLIKAFGCAIPFLEVKPGSRILDLGCGYAWTTEWLSKIGLDVIGIDINRSYIDVGLIRMSGNPPKITVGDVENLPFPPGHFDAIFGFDAFHHIPDRYRAAKELTRVLKPGGKIVFVEPGSDHEHDPNSKEVMSKYGIIEKGFTLDDLKRYFEDSIAPEQVREVSIMPIWSDDSSACVSSQEMRDYRGFLGWGVYQIYNSRTDNPKVYRRNHTECGETAKTFPSNVTLEAVLNSTSWKITYPLRFVSILVRKTKVRLRDILRF
jgi:SAM-dependent methyltransferase